MSTIDTKALFNISYGLYVVTSNDGKKHNGLIVNTVMQLTDNPNRVGVCINKANYSHDVIKQTGIMNINCLTESTPFETFKQFGFQSGKDADKFSGESFKTSENGLAVLDSNINAFISLKVASYVVDFPSEETLDMENVVNIPHLGASTPESEDNCAVMAAKELSEFMKYGNIKNSVNFPNIDLAMETKYRVTIAHKNIPNMLTNFSAIFANDNINIVNMLNKSKKDNAYTIIDVDEVPAGLKEELEAIEGVYKVRII